MHAHVLGKYRLIAALGRGGTADVFLALARGAHGFEKLVVIKRLRAEVAADASYNLLLSREARLAARLSHPNIVQTYEASEEEGVAFIAMEYLEGQPLNRVVGAARRQGAPMPPRIAVRIAADALAGLHYGHTLTDLDGTPLHVIHRDVSPHNIFVTYEGEVKLVDFGIAKTNFDAESTEVGVLKGKLAYMPPEQAMGERLDARADVFAIGLVLFELLTGKRALQGTTGAEVLRALLSQELVGPRSVMPDVDPHLDAICARALARDREDRFATAEDMREELERWLARAGGCRRDDVRGYINAAFAQECVKVRARVRSLVRAVREESPADASIDLPAVGLPVGPVSISTSDTLPTATAPTDAAQTVSTAEPTPRPRRSWFAAAGALAVAAAGLVALVSARRPNGAAPRTPTTATPPVVSPVVLRLCGSNTIGESLAPALIEAFLRKRGGTPSRENNSEAHELRIATNDGAWAVEAKGSATAFEGLVSGRCDIGMSSRPAHDEEVRAAAAAGLGELHLPASEHVVALDGIAVIAHPNFTKRSLSVDEIARIFAGEVADWGAVGAPAAKITIHARDDKSGTFDTFQHLVMRTKKLSPTATRWTDSDKLSDAVATDANAIGFVSVAYVRSAKALAIADRGAAPALPSPFTVTTESYPLSRRLFLYVPARPRSTVTLEFVNYALSPEGQAVVRNNGFIDLDIGIRDADPCVSCTAPYADVTKGARRLSVDLRFRSGLDALDSRGARDIERLVTFLRTHPGRRVRLIGFSDAAGAAELNMQLSKQRARAVAEELEARGVKPAVVVGLGAQMPVASNETADGRTRNRRVEVWLETEGA